MWRTSSVVRKRIIPVPEGRPNLGRDATLLGPGCSTLPGVLPTPRSLARQALLDARGGRDVDVVRGERVALVADRRGDRDRLRCDLDPGSERQREVGHLPGAAPLRRAPRRRG